MHIKFQVRIPRRADSEDAAKGILEGLLSKKGSKELMISLSSSMIRIRVFFSLIKFSSGQLLAANLFNGSEAIMKFGAL